MCALVVPSAFSRGAAAERRSAVGVLVFQLAVSVSKTIAVSKLYLPPRCTSGGDALSCVIMNAATSQGPVKSE